MGVGGNLKKDNLGRDQTVVRVELNKSTIPATAGKVTPPQRRRKRSLGEVIMEGVRETHRSEKNEQHQIGLKPI